MAPPSRSPALLAVVFLGAAGALTACGSCAKEDADPAATGAAEPAASPGRPHLRWDAGPRRFRRWHHDAGHHGGDQGGDPGEAPAGSASAPPPQDGR